MKALCAEILPDYISYADYKIVTENDDFPQAVYVRKDVTVVSSGSILKEQPDCGLGLYVEVKRKDQTIFIESSGQLLGFLRRYRADNGSKTATIRS